MKSRIRAAFFGAFLSIGIAAELSAQDGLSGRGWLTTDKAIQYLKSSGDDKSLAAALDAARYQIRRGPIEAPAPATAANPAHRIISTFTTEGLRLQVSSGDRARRQTHAIEWRLESLGYGPSQICVPAGALKARGTRAELVRDTPALTEWFENTPAGLEHGFTVTEPPSPNPRGEPLRLVMNVAGDLTPQADATGQNLSLRDAAGHTILTYAKLKVWDCTATELPATMQTDASHVILTVNDATARYPLTIDPVFAQQAYVKASNPGASDVFGNAVAVSSNTVVVGAPSEDSNAIGVNGDGSNNSAQLSGAVYVFVRTGNSWKQQAYLKASNTDADDNFGVSVGISGDTIVVGAGGFNFGGEDSSATGVNGDGSDNNARDSGAAYVFVRNGTNWSQQAYLKASNTGAGDRFGASVAVSGDTVVVGAALEDSNATGVNGNGSSNTSSNSGAAYVFVRDGTNWTQQAYLKASNTDADDEFGFSVGVSGNTIVVGAPGEDSNATGIDGDGGNNIAQDAGAAYVFVRNGTTWSQQAYLKASNTGLTDQFGTSVAVAGDTIVVGAPTESSNATGVNGDGNNNSASFSGAAYVFFFRNGPIAFGWIQRAYLKANNTETRDFFGRSVAVSGGTVVVGALFEDSNARGLNGDSSNNAAPESGAAYVFVRGGTVSAPTWSFQDYLKASNTGANDNFGVAVAVSGDTIVIGAGLESSNATGVNGDQNNNLLSQSGAAYIFGEPLPPAPEIAVEQPLNINIPDGGTGQEFLAAEFHIGSGFFFIRNTGDGDLTGLVTAIDGPDAALFRVALAPAPPLPPGSIGSLVVAFTPTNAGVKMATLHIASNDEDENPFDLVLNGRSLSFTEDTDGDGLNDASELQMAALGFNFQVPQPALVTLLFNNANGAGLFTQAQIQALNVDTPLLSKNPNTGLFNLTIGVQKATQLTNFVPFPMTAPQTTIDPDGKLDFQFSAPDNAAFFRLEAR